ncbi:MAG TPA: M48 family metalloprotease [Bryobacteraceae bacterium]|jgi:predicted Zn-dependent protease
MRSLAFVLIASALTLSAQTILGAGPNIYSRAKEASLGAQLAQNVSQATTPLDNAAALSYVQQMGAKLAAQLPESSFPYTFALIADSKNAGGSGDALEEPLAIPGGYVFVPARMFLTAQDDSEFAGLLAHAMAHVAERHGTRAASMNTLGAMAGTPVKANPASPMLIPASYVNFSGSFEQEADGLALKMVATAGYDPQGLIRYVSRERLNNAERIAAMQNAIQGLPHPATAEFLQIQMQLRNLPRN